MKSSETKLFIGILVVCVVLVGAVVWPNISGGRGDGHTPPPPRVVDPRTAGRQVLVPPNAEILGNPKAPFTLVEFGDYQ